MQRGHPATRPGDPLHVAGPTLLTSRRLPHELLLKLPMMAGEQNESASLSHALHVTTSPSVAAWKFAQLRQAIVTSQVGNKKRPGARGSRSLAGEELFIIRFSRCANSHRQRP